MKTLVKKKIMFVRMTVLNFGIEQLNQIKKNYMNTIPK